MITLQNNPTVATVYESPIAPIPAGTTTAAAVIPVATATETSTDTGDDNPQQTGTASVQVAKASESTSSSTDVSIVTADGDRVTFSRSSLTESSYIVYDAQGSLGGATASTHGEAASYTSSNEFSFSVEGDLSKEELKDIHKVLKRLDKITEKFLEGDIDAALNKALRLPNLDSIQSLEASIEFRYILSLEALSYQGPIGAPALPASPDSSIIDDTASTDPSTVVTAPAASANTATDDATTNGQTSVVATDSNPTDTTVAADPADTSDTPTTATDTASQSVTYQSINIVEVKAYIATLESEIASVPVDDDKKLKHIGQFLHQLFSNAEQRYENEPEKVQLAKLAKKDIIERLEENQSSQRQGKDQGHHYAFGHQKAHAA